MKVLLIGDQNAVLARFTQALDGRGWMAKTYTTLDVDPQSLADAHYDLFIIEVSAVDMRLQELLDMIRRWGNDAVVLVLGDFSVEERTRALSYGADDFLCRETSGELLLARALALLRLRSKHFQSTYEIGDLMIDVLHRQVQRGGREIALSQREFQLLVLLARYAGQTLARSDIIEQLWGNARIENDNALDAHVSRLRRKLDKPFQQKMISTVRGVGYRLFPADLPLP